MEVKLDVHNSQHISLSPDAMQEIARLDAEGWRTLEGLLSNIRGKKFMCLTSNGTHLDSKGAATGCICDPEGSCECNRLDAGGEWHPIVKAALEASLTGGLDDSAVLALRGLLDHVMAERGLGATTSTAPPATTEPTTEIEVETEIEPVPTDNTKQRFFLAPGDENEEQETNMDSQDIERALARRNVVMTNVHRGRGAVAEALVRFAAAAHLDSTESLTDRIERAQRKQQENAANAWRRTPSTSTTPTTTPARLDAGADPLARLVAAQQRQLEYAANAHRKAG